MCFASVCLHMTYTTPLLIHIVLSNGITYKAGNFTLADYGHTSILHAWGGRATCDVGPSNTVTWLPTCKAVHSNVWRYISPKWFHTFVRQLQQLQYWHTCWLTHVYASFIHCQACTAVRDCVAAFFPSEILCPEPNAPRNGDFEYLTSPATPRVGSRVWYSRSNVLYRLVGDSTVTCLATGEWSARTPTCRLTFSWFG